MIFGFNEMVSHANTTFKSSVKTPSGKKKKPTRWTVWSFVSLSFFPALAWEGKAGAAELSGQLK